MTTKTAAEQVAESLAQAVAYLDDNELNQIGSTSILHRDMRAALERWRAEQDNDGWLPIETAPKDGTRIILYRSGYEEPTAVGFWSIDFNQWNTVGYGWPWSDSDMWMPLPCAPKAASQGGEA